MCKATTRHVRLPQDKKPAMCGYHKNGLTKLTVLYIVNLHYPLFFASSWVKIRLYSENQLLGYPLKLVKSNRRKERRKKERKYVLTILQGLELVQAAVTERWVG